MQTCPPVNYVLKVLVKNNNIWGLILMYKYSKHGGTLGWSSSWGSVADGSRSSACLAYHHPLACVPLALYIYPKYPILKSLFILRQRRSQRLSQWLYPIEVRCNCGLQYVHIQRNFFQSSSLLSYGSKQSKSKFCFYQIDI